MEQLKCLADIIHDYNKWFEEVRNEIEELARFHSVAVPVVYGDGEEGTDEMVSLEELGRILSEIDDGTIGEEGLVVLNSIPDTVNQAECGLADNLKEE